MAPFFKELWHTGRGQNEHRSIRKVAELDGGHYAMEFL